MAPKISRLLEKLEGRIGRGHCWKRKYRINSSINEARKEEGSLFKWIGKQNKETLEW